MPTRPLGADTDSSSQGGHNVGREMDGMEERLCSLVLKLRAGVLIPTEEGRGRLGLSPQAVEVAAGWEGEFPTREAERASLLTAESN